LYTTALEGSVYIHILLANLDAALTTRSTPYPSLFFFPVDRVGRRPREESEVFYMESGSMDLFCMDEKIKSVCRRSVLMCIKVRNSCSRRHLPGEIVTKNHLKEDFRVGLELLPILCMGRLY
jgi:hypothetical protein